MPSRGVIWCKTDYVLEFLHQANKWPGPYTLVTGQSDYPITDQVADRKPDSVDRWFAVNAVAQRPWLEGIPLGVADPRWPHGDWSIIEEAMGVAKDKLLHVAFALSTNDTERLAAFNRFRSAPGATVRCYWSPRERPDFCGYINELARHWLTVSPPGNGIDCHRTWEALYLGVTPIVKRSPVTERFADMGLILVDDWSDPVNLVPTFMERPVNRDKLWMSYWKERIRGAAPDG